MAIMLIGSDQKTGRWQDKQTASWGKQTCLLKRARSGTLDELFPIIQFLRNAKCIGPPHLSSHLGIMLQQALLHNIRGIKDSAPAFKKHTAYQLSLPHTQAHVCTYTCTHAHTQKVIFTVKTCQEPDHQHQGAIKREPPQQLSGKESTCNAGDVGLIPGLGRSPGGKKWQPAGVQLRLIQGIRSGDGVGDLFIYKYLSKI